MGVDAGTYRMQVPSSSDSFGLDDGSYNVAGNKVVGARQSAITAPLVAGTVDTDARSVIGSILTALRNHGSIARNA